MEKKKVATFKCELLVKSTTLNYLQLWIRVLSFNNLVKFGLSPSIKRFTVLKSPLGNKRSKDQYLVSEYRYYVCLKTLNPSILLYFLDIVKSPIGVGIKVNVCKCQ